MLSGRTYRLNPIKSHDHLNRSVKWAIGEGIFDFKVISSLAEHSIDHEAIDIVREWMDVNFSKGKYTIAHWVVDVNEYLETAGKTTRLQMQDEEHTYIEQHPIVRTSDMSPTRWPADVVVVVARDGKPHGFIRFSCSANAAKFTHMQDYKNERRRIEAAEEESKKRAADSDANAQSAKKKKNDNKKQSYIYLYILNGIIKFYCRFIKPVK